MGVWQPVTNLKDYVVHNPPVVTFFFCLLSLAISFISLSSYSYTHTLPNPDVAKDWNYLLSSLSQLKLCQTSEPNESELASPVPSHPVEQENNIKSASTQTSSSVTTFQLQVRLNVTSSPAGGSVDGLYSTLKASQLHLGGNEIMNVTLEFLSGDSAHTCLTISAPTQLLPRRLLPPECPAFERNSPPVHVEVSNQLFSASQTCFSLHYDNDPTLTVMLTQRERSVAARHQLELSVFLLIVCFVLCLTASMTHWLTRCSHLNGLDPKHDPLIDT